MSGRQGSFLDRAGNVLSLLVALAGSIGLGGCAMEAEKQQQSQFDRSVHDRIVHYLVQEDETPLRREGLSREQAHGAMWAMFNQGGSQCAALARKLMADEVMLELSPGYQSVEDVAGMRKRMTDEHLCDEGHVH